MSVSPSSSSGLLLISDRPLDTIFDRLPTVFVPSYAATLGHLTDVAHSYDDLEHQDYVDEQYTRIPEEYIYQFKQLQHQPWRFFYLDLDRLSREIQSLHQFMLLHDNTSIIDQQQTSFIRTLDAELAKVNDFYSLKLGEIQRRVSFCHAQPETKKGRLDTEINHTLPNEIALLAHFSKSNYRALFAVLARYDSQVLSLQRQRQPVLQNQLYRLVSSKLFYRPADLLELMSSLNKLHKAMRSVHVSLPTQDSLLSIPGMTSPDDELRQVPNFTSIYISPTSEAADSTPYLPPSPALSSDEEERSTYTASSSGDSCITGGSTDGEQQRHGMISVQQFWVHPDNLVEIMLHVGKYLDIQDTTLPQAQTDTVTTNNPHYSHGITTLHLDTPQLTSYTERAVASDNGKSHAASTALRIRWYHQEQHTTSNKPVVALEEKVYCSTNTHVSSGKRRSATRRGHKSLGKSPYRPSSNNNDNNHLQAASLKDGAPSSCKSRRHVGSKSYFKHRLWFKSKHMDPWLAGDWSLRHVLSKPECKHWHLSKKNVTAAAANNDEETTEQVLAMEENARACHMEPVLKTMLNRTVYADSASDLVITIDTEIAMARPIHDNQEVHADDYYHSSSSSGSDDYFMQYHHHTLHKSSSFKSSDNYPYPSMAPNDIVRFPFAVIKISGSDSLQDYPSWLSKLCNSPLMEPVHDFSTYLHGVSVLMPHRVHVFPGWLSEMSIDLTCVQDRGTLIKPAQRTLTVDTGATDNNHLQLPPTPWSSSSAIASLSDKSNSSSGSNSTRATTPNSNHHHSPSANHTAKKFDDDHDKQETERAPLLKRKHDSFESYCSFDHPSSSRSDPSTCRDCHARRRQSSSYSQRSKSSTSMKSIDHYGSPLAHLGDHMQHFFQSLWPSIPPFGHHHGPILPTHNNNTTTATHETMNPMPSQRRGLKLIVLCSIVSTSLVFLFYYSLSTL